MTLPARLTRSLPVLALIVLSCAAPWQGYAGKKPKPGPWQVLFDGESTAALRAFKGADFPADCWEVQDGALRAKPGEKTVDLVSREKFSNFELELEWKVSPGANSGVIYRVSEEPDAPWKTGPEMQVLDDARHADGKNPLTSAGSLYALIAPQGAVFKEVGRWNKARLVVDGNHVEHWLNGVKVVDYTLGSTELKARIARSKFKDLPRFSKESEGHICLQHHHDEVWFRKVRIRTLAGH